MLWQCRSLEFPLKGPLVDLQDKWKQFMCIKKRFYNPSIQWKWCERCKYSGVIIASINICERNNQGKWCCERFLTWPGALQLISQPALMFSPAFQFRLISGRHDLVNGCALWLIKLTLNRVFPLKLYLFKYQGQTSSVSEVAPQGPWCPHANILGQAGRSSWKSRNLYSHTVQAIFFQLYKGELAVNLTPCVLGISDFIYIYTSFF